MRGADERSGALFSYVGCEDRVPAPHPLRAIRLIVNATLAGGARSHLSVPRWMWRARQRAGLQHFCLPQYGHARLRPAEQAS